MRKNATGTQVDQNREDEGGQSSRNQGAEQPNSGYADNRPLGLRMGYESMWSLLDDVSTDDLMAERDRFKGLSNKLRTEAAVIDSKRDVIQRKSRVLEEVIGNRKWAETRDKFKLSDNHIALVKMLYFGKLDATPSLGYSYSEMAKKLGWKLPNDDVSDEQREALEHLIYELPLALEAVIAVSDLRLDSPETKEEL